MNTTKIGKIQKVKLRDVWRREDANFTTWLENNIDHLTDVLGFNINIESREKKVGPFSVDLYGEDDDGHNVIIENQLEKTDHTHLGQILTYLTNLEAKTAIWISSEPVEEHLKAIDWLNETTPDDIAFYLVQVEAVKIGEDSPPAPLFTVVRRPNIAIKQIGTEKKEIAQRHITRKEYWTHFLEKMNERSEICQTISPSIRAWLSVALGVSGVPMYIAVSNESVRTEIYIDTGDKEKNKKIYDYFFAHKDQIESDFKGKLLWQRMEDNKVSKVENWLREVNVSKKEDWDKITEFLIESAIRMHAAFKKHIQGLRSQNL